MPIPLEERERVREAARQAIAKYLDADLNQFTRPDLGPLSFEELRPVLAPIFDTIRVLAQLPIAELPYPMVQQLLSGLGQLETRLNELRNFNLLAISQAGNNPVQIRQGLLGQWDGAENNIWSHIGPAVAFLAGVQAQHAPEATVSEARRIIAEAEKSRSTAEESRKELDDIVRASRDAVAEVGASRHATLFKTEADEHKAAAGRWLTRTAVAAGVTVLVVLINLIVVYVKDDTPPASSSLVQLGLAKIFAFSVLLSATIWCGKMYRAARHNEVVNRHRQNALGSFEAFVKAATDDQTKNAVLLHAAQSIFAPQSSGFVHSDADHATPQLVELVRTIGPSSKTT